MGFGRCDGIYEYFRKTVFYTARKVMIQKRRSYTVDELEPLRNDVFLRILDHDCDLLRKYNEDKGRSLKNWIILITNHTVLNEINRTKDMLDPSHAFAGTTLDKM